MNGGTHLKCYAYICYLKNNKNNNSFVSHRRPHVKPCEFSNQNNKIYLSFYLKAH